MPSSIGPTPMFCACECPERAAQTAAGYPNWSLIDGACRAFAAGTQ
jgi:hypothetical protein